MNKILLLSLSLVSLFALSGCLLIPQGYTEDAVLSNQRGNKRYAVTFSVDYLSDGEVSVGRASQKQYIEWLKEDLRDSGAFSSVTYKPFAQKSNYHIHFLIHYSGMPMDEHDDFENVLGCTLGMIPMWYDTFLDASAILYLNGKPIHSPAASEALRCYVWLPFLPVGLVWNKWWAWTTQEKKCCRYLIHELSEYQRMKL